MGVARACHFHPADEHDGSACIVSIFNASVVAILANYSTATLPSSQARQEDSATVLHEIRAQEQVLDFSGCRFCVFIFL